MNARVILVLLAFIAAPAFAQIQCRSVQIEELPFEVDQVPISYEKSFRELTQEHGNTGVRLAVVHGFFESWPTVRVIPVQPQDSTFHCRVQVGFERMKIYVAAELQPDACATARIVEHEREHGKIYKAHAAKVIEQFRSTPPGKSSDIGRAIFAALDATESQHAELDSPAEVKRNLTVCDGRILRAAAQAHSKF